MGYQHRLKQILPVAFGLTLLLSCAKGGGGNGVPCTHLSKAALTAPPVHSKSGASWTVLVYLAGDNNLSDAALRDLEEMEAVGSTDAVTVVVQIDTFDGTAKRLKVSQGCSFLIKDLGEQDMADPAVLTDFISWGTTSYPAGRTALILWSHGDRYQKPGWGRTPDSILQDGTICCLSNLLVRQAIEDSGKHFDLLGFDASQMGFIETAFEFRKGADLLIFSQETGEENGWDYTGILKGLSEQPDMDAQELAGLMIETYEAFYEGVLYPAENTPFSEQIYTISAISLGQNLEDSIEKINDLANALMTSLNSPTTQDQTVDAIGTARDQAQGVISLSACPFYMDLFDWVQILQSQPGLDSSVESALSGLSALQNSLILDEYHGKARAGAKGLSIVFFKDPKINCNISDPGYLDGTSPGPTPLAFLTDTSWNEFLSAYYTASGLL